MGDITVFVERTTNIKKVGTDIKESVDLKKNTTATFVITKHIDQIILRDIF